MRIGRSNGSLAIFVKTPGLSPIKTRLSASIGPTKTIQFYDLSICAIKALMQMLQAEIPPLHIYFAVAEKEGLNSPLWSGFPTIWQGDGTTLGERLTFVYDQLLEKHLYACFIGADSPHLSFIQIYKAVLTTENVKETDFVLGETEDGGFYFFGGGVPIPKQHWLNIKYSTENTAKELKTELDAIAPIRLLQKNFDIDTLEDLKKYHREEFPLYNLLKEQLALIHWARKQK